MTTPQIQSVEWVKVTPYLVVLGTAIAGMNVTLVLILGIAATGIIGILTGSINFFDWFGSLGTGITGMGDLIIITLMAGGTFITQKWPVEWIILSKNSPNT